MEIITFGSCVWHGGMWKNIWLDGGDQHMLSPAGLQGGIFESFDINVQTALFEGTRKSLRRNTLKPRQQAQVTVTKV